MLDEEWYPEESDFDWRLVDELDSIDEQIADIFEDISVYRFIDHQIQERIKELEDDL